MQRFGRLAIVLLVVTVSLALALLPDTDVNSSTTTSNSVQEFRYAGETWVHRSELATCVQVPEPGPFERISPITWATMQLLLALLILLLFEPGGSRTVD